MTEEATTTSRRTVTGVYGGGGFHWVGDGFHVTQVFPGAHDLGALVSPFLLMDYHAPYDYEPTETPRGVGVHPHRGFETVTLAFDGALEHHDSSGGGGIIRAGDVQWMTAASGVLHKEFHETEWARAGGRMHMMQLWVNLPAAHKLDPPRYQALLADQMGRVERDGTTVTVVAGEFSGAVGPAKTVTPIQLWRVEMRPGARFSADIPHEHNAALFVMEGNVTANGVPVAEHHLATFDHDGTGIEVETTAAAHFLVLAGEPIDEPVVSYGPFVMNTRQEIIQAIEDFNSGRFGTLV
jgi:redox-sensitive bicupin YhaK (pirin superfamily)